MKIFQKLVCPVFLWVSFVCPSPAKAKYLKATEGPDVVKNKLYPRAQRFFLHASGGAIINPAYVDTIILNGAVGYHASEWHTFSLGVSLGLAQDRTERQCIETYFFDTSKSGASCDVTNTANPKPGVDQKDDPYRKRPAYMPIREFKNMVTINYDYTPVYGKGILFSSLVHYLDLYFHVGAGLAFSNYYPLKRLDNELQGVSDNNLTGVSGRPPVQSSVLPLINLGLGNRFYFLNNFMITAEIQDLIVLSFGDASSEFSNISVLGGVGVIF